ncbi:MAG: hypothetical protein H0V18_05930 [Pyrinomonadaceae bacterium]|nr:hypothetical protein [Pyrinomonadaceae bacterium]
MGYFSDDEDLDWDEWMKLSDGQAEAIVQAEEKKYFDWLDSLKHCEQDQPGRLYGRVSGAVP